MSTLFSSKNWARFGQLVLLLLLLGGAYYLFSPSGLAGQNLSLQRELVLTQREQSDLLGQVASLQAQLAPYKQDSQTIAEIALRTHELDTLQAQQRELYRQIVEGSTNCRFPTPTPERAAYHREVELLRDQVAFANADCTRQLALAQNPPGDERKRLLQKSRKAFINIIQLSDNDGIKQSARQVVQGLNKELGQPIYSFQQLPN